MSRHLRSTDQPTRRQARYLGRVTGFTIQAEPPLKFHIVVHEPHGWLCSCPDYQDSERCEHVAAADDTAASLWEYGSLDDDGQEA